MARSTKVNLFAQAKAHPIVKIKGSKPEPDMVQTESLETYAYLDTLIKNLDALRKTVASEIHPQMMDQFVKNHGKNYKGVDSTASASLELRKRSSTSGLQEHEVMVLAKHNIPMIEVEGDFKLNLQGVSAQKLEEVSKAISSVKGLPENFVQFDASKCRTITTDESIAAAFRLNDETSIREVLSIVGVTAIKAKTSAKTEAILKMVSEMMED